MNSVSKLAIAMLLFANTYSRSQEPMLISPIGSERATSGAGNKIITFGDKTQIVWQDATQQGYHNRVRTYDRRTSTWSEPFTLNRGRDNHARPVIAVDKQGYLHVILSGHNSPVTYRRSTRPNDATAWTEAEDAGSGTYPVVTCGLDGTVYLTLRSSNRWNGVDLYAKPPNEKWRKTAKLIVRDPELPGYAGYQNGLAWSPDHKTLHMVVDFYESVETYKLRGVHQAVCYMKSGDGGETWQRADGTNIKLPARPEQMDTLAQSRGDRKQRLPPPFILAQGGIVVDSDGLPHVFYVSHLDEPGQVIHARPNAQGEWQQTPVDAIAKAYLDHRPMACRGALTIDRDDSIYMLLELKPLGKLWIDGKPVRGLGFATEGKRLAWLISRDCGKSFAVQQAIDDEQVFNQANVERPAGFNEISAGQLPPFVYFDGTSRYPKGREVLQNNVFLRLPSLPKRNGVIAIPVQP